MAPPRNDALAPPGSVYHSGRRHVAIALSEAAQPALLAWVPFSPHLASACLKGTIANLTVITVFSPALNAEDRGGGEGIIL